MAEQRLHTQLAAIDVLTRVELEEVMSHQFEQAERTRLRGVDIARLPPVTALGNGGTVNLASIGSSDSYCGPEQGDVWMLRRVIVSSSAFSSDTARYVLFRGATPSDIANAYTNRQLLDGIAFSTVLGQQVGIAYQCATKACFIQPGEQIYAQVFNSTAGNTYILNGEAIRVPAEMKGKLLI
jgi:hypothetical protein